MIRLLVALLVAGLVLYVLLFRQGGDAGRSAALYENQLRQAREVEAQLQRQLEERMKQIDEAAWQRSGIGEEEYTSPGPPPWREEEVGPPVPGEED